MGDMAGKLKEGWKIYRFDQMAINVNERINDPSKADTDYYVGLEHLDSDSLKIRRWGTPSDVEATKLIFRKGDIIFGRRNAYLRRVAVADFDGICSAHALVLRARPEVVLPDFLPFFMQTNQFWESALKISAGSMSPTINWKNLAKEEFALPPLEEQKRITNLFKKIDEFVRAYHDALEITLQLRLSIRASEFNPSRYSTCKLASLCAGKTGIQIGPFGAQLHQSDYISTGIPVIMPANMQDERIDTQKIAKVSEEKAKELSVHRVKAGDILLPRRGELDRRSYVSKIHEGWLCGTGSIRIRVGEDVSSKGVFHALSSVHVVRWLNGNAVGTTMPNLNSQIVSNIPVSLPPKDRLVEVINVLDEIEEKIDLLREQFAKAQQIRLSLLVKVLEKNNAFQ